MRYYFRTGPPPYQTHFNLPSPFQTLPVAQLQSQNWPSYPDQLRSALMSPGTYQINKDVFFLPLPAVRHPYAGAVGAVEAVRNAQAQYAMFQGIALRNYLGGHPLTPAQAQAVLALRMPAPQDEIAFNRYKMQQCPPLGGGARQVSFHPRANPPVAVLKYMQAVQRGCVINPGQTVNTTALRMEQKAQQLATAVYEQAGARVLPNIQQPGVQMANNLTRAMVAPTAYVPAAAMAVYAPPVNPTRLPFPSQKFQPASMATLAPPVAAYTPPRAATPRASIRTLVQMRAERKR